MQVIEKQDLCPRFCLQRHLLVNYWVTPLMGKECLQNLYTNKLKVRAGSFMYKVWAVLNQKVFQTHALLDCKKPVALEQS